MKRGRNKSGELENFKKLIGGGTIIRYSRLKYGELERAFVEKNIVSLQVNIVFRTTSISVR